MASGSVSNFNFLVQMFLEILGDKRIMLYNGKGPKKWVFGEKWGTIDPKK